MNRRTVALPSLSDLRHELDSIEAAHRAGTLRHAGAREPASILSHLAISIKGSIDGMPELTRAAPLLLRIFGPLASKRVLSRPLQPGVRMSARAESALWPTPESFEASLADLRRQLDRLSNGEVPIERHPVFGRLSPQQWLVFHLRHAELHLSFIHWDAA